MTTHLRNDRPTTTTIATILTFCLMGCSGNSLVAGRALPTNGSTMLLSQDDRIAVSVQRNAHSVSVFRVDHTGSTATLAAPTILDMGAASEPWSAVMGNDGDTAYVILRHDQQVVQINHLHTTPTIGARAATESEPTGIAISPSGTTLFIANWNQGTLTRVRTMDMVALGPIDLNHALVDTGLLGDGATPRPGLAHPRGLVITDDGDGNDANESVWVTEFFAQTLRMGDVPMGPRGVLSFDRSRVGIVYRVPLDGTAIQTVRIAPVTDTGFNDSTGAATGCVPNQLQAPTLHRGKLYIASNCASPDGPTGPESGHTPQTPDESNFRTLMHPVIFVVDTNTRTSMDDAAIVLSRQYQNLFDSLNVPDTEENPFGFLCDGARRRVPLMPNDIAFVPGTDEFYVSSYGANAVFRVALNSAGRLDHVGHDQSSGALQPQYIDLVHPEAQGRLPTGIAIGQSHTETLLVSNENSANVSVANLTDYSVAAVSAVRNPPSESDPINEARRFFATGTGRWSYRAQGWSSCEGCHPDGLSDGITWFFKRGPRQSPSLAGVYALQPGAGTDPATLIQRMLSWTASFDEVQDLESITRALQGGVGSFVWQMPLTGVTIADRIEFEMTPLGGVPRATGHSTAQPQDFLNGSSESVSDNMPMPRAPDRSIVNFYQDIDLYVRTIRAPLRPVRTDSMDVAGRQIFINHNCTSCHGTALWSVSRRFYAPGESASNPYTGSLRSSTYQLNGFPAALNPVAMMGSATFRFTDTAHPDTWTGNDQMNCALRSVGTVRTDSTGSLVGVSESVPVLELRQDLSVAQGADGFNPPSLMGVGSSAPYLHAGNARTLEELFHSTVFAQHADPYSASPSPIPDTEIPALVAFLTSIDRDAAPEALTQIPTSTGGHVDPDLCAQFVP